MIRVAVIDNDKLVPAGLRALLSDSADLDLVYSGARVRDYRDYLDAAAPADVVLLDLQLEDGTMPAANVTALRETGVRVLVISVHGDRRHIRATIRAGASGYLIKDDDGAKFAEAIRAVHSGRLALTTELMTIINDDPPELSPQELQVLYLYGTGSTLAATARRLGIAIPTVRSYLDRIRAKWAAADEPVEDVRTLIHEYPRDAGYRCPVSLKLTRVGGRPESHRTMVIAQFAWSRPIQRHTGASSTWRTNQPMTKLWVMSSSYRSSSPVTPKCSTAFRRAVASSSRSSSGTPSSQACHRAGYWSRCPAEGTGVRSATKSQACRGMSGRWPATMSAVCAARANGLWWIAEKGTVRSRRPSRSACSRPSGERPPSPV
jgi:DNA-binding NarL/FixJ family response regulator